MIGRFLLGVLSAIELNHDTFFKTTKVDNHRAYDKLASKLVALKLARPECRPKAFLRFSLFSPELACSIS
ncbi:MAG TPA: hypothetical protein VFD87_10555 [Phototrophicaceae bacterium]|nr:hypothetical protein [Phototrophicaceae bacterium]